MNAPPQSGVIIYSRNIKKLSQFYIEMFGMASLRETDEFVSIGKNGFNIVVHVPPIEIPENNFNAVKLFLTVQSLEQAKIRAIELGGEVFDGQWSNPLFKICNIADPEGNHIQIREFE